MNLRQAMVLEPAPASGVALWSAPLWRWAAWVLATALLMWPSTASMVEIWWTSGTFNHALGLPAVLFWLVWRRRAQWLTLVPQPDARWWWCLLPAAALAVLNEAAVAKAPGHFALVLMWVLSVPALLGTAVARQWAFALGYAFFMVPLGDFMLAPMMDWTATVTVWAVRLSGVPVYREGLDFVIPSGAWSVVEACSGVRYLIASVCVGVLYAHLSYRSWRKRLLFVAAALVVPTAANWLRAYGIVMLGHWSDNALATGVDHLVYGWLFFGLVLGLLFWVGGRWAEPTDPVAGPVIDSARVGATMAAAPDVAQAARAAGAPEAAGAAAAAEGHPGHLRAWGSTLALVAVPLAMWNWVHWSAPEGQVLPFGGVSVAASELVCPLRGSSGSPFEQMRTGDSPSAAGGSEPVWLSRSVTSDVSRSQRLSLGADWGPADSSGLKQVRGKAPEPLVSASGQALPAQWWQRAEASSLPLSQAEAVNGWLVVRWLHLDGRWMAPGTSARWALVSARLQGRSDRVETWVACTPLASETEMPLVRERLQRVVDQLMKGNAP